MEAMEALLGRRSTRKMKPEVPDRKLLEQVLTAGKAAPSGGNSHTMRFLVITSPCVLEDLSHLVCQEFAKMTVGEDTYASIRHSVEASKRGDYVFHYNAPVLIVTMDQKSYGNAMADSSCALENMMIACQALGLGSCWINQLHWLDENPLIRSYLKGLGLTDEETITGGLIVGYPSSELKREPREAYKGSPVLWAE